MSKKNDHNIIHDMSNGLKNNSDQSKVKARLEELRNAISNKNIQGSLDFEIKNPDIVIDTRSPESIKIANVEMAKIRNKLRP